MKRATIIVADDHAIILDGLRRILETEFELVATAANGRELLEGIRLRQPSAVVADVSMPELNGLDAMRQAVRDGYSGKFVFLTGNLDVGLATQAFRMGASGYVLKQSAAEELIVALRAALNGQTYITPRIANEVLQNLMAGGGKAAGPGLTVREREVLQLLAEGKTLKEAAAVLSVSPRTIEFHRNNIAEKTGLRTTAELARYAAHHGLVGDIT
jgi:DNA-binding NarL/FixJ family response regulator